MDSGTIIFRRRFWPKFCREFGIFFLKTYTVCSIYFYLFDFFFLLVLLYLDLNLLLSKLKNINFRSRYLHFPEMPRMLKFGGKWQPWIMIYVLPYMCTISWYRAVPLHSIYAYFWAVFVRHLDNTVKALHFVSACVWHRESWHVSSIKVYTKPDLLVFDVFQSKWNVCICFNMCE